MLADYLILILIAVVVLIVLCSIEWFVRWLIRWLFVPERARHFACGRCELHGTDVEHDLHIEQNLPDPFTGQRPRGAQ